MFCECYNSIRECVWLRWYLVWISLETLMIWVVTLMRFLQTPMYESKWFSTGILDYMKNRCFWSFWKKHVIYRWCGGASGETEPPHHGKALQLSHHFHQRTLPLKLTKVGVMKTPLSVKGWGAPVALFHGQHGGTAPPATLISHVPELHRILEVLHSTVLASR